MVEKTGSGHIITAAERIDIRKMRLDGVSHMDIADRLGCGRAAVSKVIQAHDLDAPASESEVAWLILWDEFRQYSGQLEAADLDGAERARLSRARAQLGATLIRTRKQTARLVAQEETTMTRQSKAMAERARILAMGEDELRNEIRRLAGLEDKQSLRSDKRQDADGGDGEAVSQPVHVASQGRAKATER